MKITLVTACSRPENLQKLFDSINFSCIWYIVFDLEENEYLKVISNNVIFKNKWIKTYFKKGGISGNLQRNIALDKIKSGFIYFLDDDNLIHPDFYKITIALLKINPTKKCILYSQESKNKVRKVFFDSIKVGKIDQAQFLIHTDLIKNKRYIQKYEADGLFIQEIFEQNSKDLFFIFNARPITYYNKLCKK